MLEITSAEHWKIRGQACVFGPPQKLSVAMCSKLICWLDLSNLN